MLDDALCQTPNEGEFLWMLKKKKQLQDHFLIPEYRLSENYLMLDLFKWWSEDTSENPVDLLVSECLWLWHKVDIQVSFLSDPHNSWDGGCQFRLCCDDLLGVHIESSSFSLQGFRTSEDLVSVILCQKGEKMEMLILKVLASYRRYWNNSGFLRVAKHALRNPQGYTIVFHR